MADWTKFVGREIERKFLVIGEAWRNAVVEDRAIQQGYLIAAKDRVLRVRIVDGASAVITIKIASEDPVERREYEYGVPIGDGRELLDLCGGRVVGKRRHTLRLRGKAWVIDVFEGRHAGLVLAEIELAAADEPFERPAWLGDEVTDDPGYGNAALAGA